MPSKEYKNLKKRLNEIKRHFIPKRSATGEYTDRQYDRMRAVRLLVHAEIESYLENWAVCILTNAQDKWKNYRKPSGVLMCLLSFSEYSFKSIPDTINSLKSQHNTPQKDILYQDDIDERVKQVVQRHYHAITKDNHGIKEKNLLKMFLPIGLENEEFHQSQALIFNLDSYGVNRGIVAHESAASQQPIDPVTEVQTIDTLLNNLKVFDEALSRLNDSI